MLCVTAVPGIFSENGVMKLLCRIPISLTASLVSLFRYCVEMFLPRETDIYRLSTITVSLGLFRRPRCQSFLPGQLFCLGTLM